MTTCATRTARAVLAQCLLSATNATRGGVAAGAKRGRDAILSGEPVEQALSAAKDAIRAAGFASIDYVALVDPGTLEPMDEPRGAMRLIAAATIGGTRLIDNIAVETGQSLQA